MIDVRVPIADIHGRPVRTDGEVMTVGSCCLAALQHLFPGEDASAEVKVRRFRLAVRIAQADGPVSLTADDITAIKLVVGKFWNPLVVGRCFEVLDPQSMPV